MISLLGWAAAALCVLLSWPQIWLSCVKGRTLGLSATACWLATALNACWFVYGILLGDTVQIATNLVCGAGNLAILVALLAHQPGLRSRRTLVTTGWGAAALLVAAAGAMAATEVPGISPARAAATLGAVTSAVGIFSYFPQLLALLRERGQDLSGMSRTRWWLAAGSSALWTSYGVAVGQPAVWTLSAFGLVCNLTVCYLLATPRRTAPVPAPAYAETAPELALAA
jgi:uncharacterized protein with PQ loop repeat